MQLCVAIFNFKISIITSSRNTAVDFLSRLVLKVKDKIRLKIREDVQTKPIEVAKYSSYVADGEHFFFMLADGKDGT